jgi:hypothetical protein
MKKKGKLKKQQKKLPISEVSASKLPTFPAAVPTPISV